MVSFAIASVLIVDDSSTMRHILRDMLDRLAVRSIEEAGDGAEALAKIQASPYSLIISDWHMEPVNGLELLQTVRRISKPKTNRFIFTTGDRSWGRQASAKLDGADAFIVKPFTIETLRSKMQLVLQK